MLSIPLIFLFAAKTIILSSRFTSAASPNAMNQPLEIPFNTTATLGPDGPWNFITLSVGTNLASNVSFFPQALGDISILTSGTDCSSNSSLCITGAEYFDGQAAGKETGPPNTELYWQQLNATTKLGQSNWTNITGSVSYWEESFKAPLNLNNISVLISQNNSHQQGKSTYSPVSLLQLDCTSNSNWDSNLNSTGDGTQQNISLSWPVKGSSQNGLPQSYHLHMGSAMFNQSGSLYFGGYDRKRIIEPMYPFSGINLHNITFGTASGQNLWDGYNSTHLDLPIFVGKISGAVLAPEYPYMLMTTALCSAMEGSLPIYHDYDSNLYLWKQDDPKYHALMSSSSYMNFTIGTDNQTLAIKIPFATLNLTLEPPITKTPAPYFPCYPSDQDTLVLGRAFLQSVNLGYVGDGSSIISKYIGQAPGPSIGRDTTPDPVLFSVGNYEVPSGAPSWEDTWASTWAELSGNHTISKPDSVPIGTAPGSKPTSTPSMTRPGLSGGQIAGITVGVIVAVAVTVASSLWLVAVFRRNRTAKNSETLLNDLRGSRQSKMFSELAEDKRGSRVELNGTYIAEKQGTMRVEADGGTLMYELSATSGPVELPIEMPTPSKATS